jgi:predicted nucleotidyltransferase
MITRNNTLTVAELFFKYPERKFHLRELERLTKLSMPGVRNIANRLVKEGLLDSESEKVVKNYYARRDDKFVRMKRVYNLYSIFFSGLLDFIKNEYKEPETIILFGSYSRGEDISKSDIDIAVITADHKESDLSAFEKKLARKIKIYEIRIEKAEREFLNTLGNGIVLYGYLKVAR